MKKQKQLGKKLAKILVLTDLLIQEVDDVQIGMKPQPMLIEINDKSKELQTLLEPVLDEFYKNKEVSKSTFFITMQEKFNYIFNKEYK